MCGFHQTFIVQISTNDDTKIKSAAPAILVGDGGPVFGGSESITIQAINYATGTIWQSVATTPRLLTNQAPALPSAATIANVTINDIPTEVAAQGTLLFLTLDLSSQTTPRSNIPLTFDASFSQFGNIAGVLASTFAPGTLTINAVPEPNAFIMSFLVAVAIGARTLLTTASRCGWIWSYSVRQQ